MPQINNPGSTTVNVTTVRSPSQGGPLLHPHQRELLEHLLAAYRRDHSDFNVMADTGAVGSGVIVHHEAMGGGTSIQRGDLVALERAGMIDVATDQRGGISRFAPTAFASMSMHPDDYFDLSDEAWAIARDTLRNRPERVRDVQIILRRICEDTENPSSIRATAQAADLLLDQVEKFIDTGNPGDEPLARASTASLRALALTILRFGGPEVLGAAVEAFREVRDLFES